MSQAPLSPGDRGLTWGRYALTLGRATLSRSTERSFWCFHRLLRARKKEVKEKQRSVRNWIQTRVRVLLASLILKFIFALVLFGDRKESKSMFDCSNELLQSITVTVKSGPPPPAALFLYTVMWLRRKNDENVDSNMLRRKIRLWYSVDYLKDMTGKNLAWANAAVKIKWNKIQKKIKSEWQVSTGTCSFVDQRI